MGERKSFLLRIPPDLHQELERWARDDLRSINAQIEFLLRRAVQERRKGRAPDPPAAGTPPSDSTPSR